MLRLVGTGIDIVEVERIKGAVERTPSFLQRVFTPGELAYAGESERHRWRRLAARFAAKEALLKALGTGLRRVRWTDAEVNHDALGQPYFVLSGRLDRLARSRGATTFQLSLSHSDAYAVAHVLAIGPDTAEPPPAPSPAQGGAQRARGNRGPNAGH